MPLIALAGKNYSLERSRSTFVQLNFHGHFPTELYSSSLSKASDRNTLALCPCAGNLHCPHPICSFFFQNYGRVDLTGVVQDRGGI
ncbi:unnamed protein product [Rhodiola kirilowii]